MALAVPRCPTVVDLFSGAGGLSEGFRQAGFEPILGVDTNEWAVKTYQRYHGKGLLESVENLTADRILDEIGGQAVTVLAAGPPCQAFSTVAVAKLRSLGRSSTRRNPLNVLYREVLRLVNVLKPPFFIMENVGRMFSMSDGAIKHEIEKELEGKYKVNFYYENVANFGVPQNRKRGLVIGNNLGLQNPELVRTHHDPEFTDSHNTVPFETLRNAISDLPRIRAGGGAETMEYPELVSPLTEYQRDRRRDSRFVYNHVARKHSTRDLEIFRLLKPGQWISDLPEDLNPYRNDIFLDKFKKQPWDKPSSTILAHLSKDGLMFIHPDPKQNRSLTAREAARLQSFDDTYVFEGPRTQQYIQIGNAVPPLFAKAIAKAITEKLLIALSPVSEPVHSRR
jgi:DNA (cytosine-5)-methyltransferase 1